MKYGLEFTTISAISNAYAFFIAMIQPCDLADPDWQRDRAISIKPTLHRLIQIAAFSIASWTKLIELQQCDPRAIHL
ncbi:MAG: hypothetical protein MUC48_19205 [Leptolyngbya sp. Prado105]|jgi:hypothetical protein|nr:hypothetical protein [Leptolyngbya sp. Prado105]